MTFEKPKVTIDLEEYNFLNKQIEELKKDKDNLEFKALKYISGSLINYIGSNYKEIVGNIERQIKEELGFKMIIIQNNHHRGLKGYELELEK